MSLVDDEKSARGDEETKSRPVHYGTHRRMQSNAPKIRGERERRIVLGEESKRQVRLGGHPVREERGKERRYLLLISNKLPRHIRENIQIFRSYNYICKFVSRY